MWHSRSKNETKNLKLQKLRTREDEVDIGLNTWEEKISELGYRSEDDYLRPKTISISTYIDDDDRHKGSSDKYARARDTERGTGQWKWGRSNTGRKELNFYFNEISQIKDSRNATNYWKDKFKKKSLPRHRRDKLKKSKDNNNNKN